MGDAWIVILAVFLGTWVIWKERRKPKRELESKKEPFKVVVKETSDFEPTANSEVENIWPLIRGEEAWCKLENLIKDSALIFKKLKEEGLSDRKCLQQIQLPKYQGRTVLYKQSEEEVFRTADLLSNGLNSGAIQGYLNFTKNVSGQEMSRVTDFFQKSFGFKKSNIIFVKDEIPNEIKTVLCSQSLILFGESIEAENMFELIPVDILNRIYKEAYGITKGSKKREILYTKITESSRALEIFFKKYPVDKFIKINTNEIIDWKQVREVELRARFIQDCLLRMTD